MKPKKTISAHILTFGLMTLLMVGSFVIFQIYLSLSKSQISSVQQKAIKPLDGRIDQEIVDDLGGRRWFNRAEMEKPILKKTPIATETGKVEVVVTEEESEEK
jgi:hypothetical protein